LIEGRNEPSDDDHRRVGDQKLDNFFNGLQLVILAKIDDTAGLCLIHDTAVGKRESALELPTHSCADGIEMTVGRVACSRSDAVDPFVDGLVPDIGVLVGNEYGRFTASTPAIIVGGWAHNSS
jgi:hypothetical protein